MPKSTPRRPGKPGQNRDLRDGVFGHPESQVGPLPRGGLYAPRLDTASAHDRDAAAAAARVPGTPSLAEGPRCRRGRLRIQASPGERPSTRRCAAARDRHHPERNLPISGPAGSLRVIFHTVAAQAPTRWTELASRAREAIGVKQVRWIDNDRLWYVVHEDRSIDPITASNPEVRVGIVRLY